MNVFGCLRAYHPMHDWHIEFKDIFRTTGSPSPRVAASRASIHCMTFLSIIMCMSPSSRAAEPELKWSFHAESNLYAAPVVADVHPAPGLETIISDSEIRPLRCLDAAGREVWQFKPGWTKRLTSTASLSFTARPGKGTLVIGNADGLLCCVDAESGSEVWRRDVGRIEWGAAIWADLDGDRQDEIIAGTEDSGVAALSAEGRTLWVCVQAGDGRALRIVCPVGAADIDGDGRAEVFAVDSHGLVCIAADGTIRWEAGTGDEFLSSPVVGHLREGEGLRLICASRNENALHIFNALDGAIEYSCPLLGSIDVYSGASIALGDIAPDEWFGKEIVLGDATGNVYCFDAKGTLLWLFRTEKRTHVACTLGDIDGDGDIETLAACGDRSLYCLDSAGKLKWRFETGLRLIHPPTLADIDQDGRTDILFGGSDGILRCLCAGGAWRPELAPWPSRRFDLAQTGFDPKRPREDHPRPVTREERLLINPGFAPTGTAEGADALPERLRRLRLNRPAGWLCTTPHAGSWGLEGERDGNGTPGLYMTADGSERMVVSSAAVLLEPAVARVRAAATLIGSGGTAELAWIGATGVIARSPLDAEQNAPGDAAQKSPGRPSPAAGQQELVADVARPRGAEYVRLALAVSPGRAVHWTRADLVAVSEHPPEAQVLINQAGYDVDFPKRFTVQANFVEKPARFEVVSETGRVAHRGDLEAQGRIVGAYGNDWGWNYWRGDFSPFDEPGVYRIQVVIGKTSASSYPFAVAARALWDKTARPAYRFFYYQRCGTDVPGFHGPCHLDDAVSPDGQRQYELTGGWHDAGDYNKYHNAPYLFGLARAYGVQRALFDCDDDRNAIPDIWQEILWGSEHVRRMVAPDGSAYGPITSGYGFWGPPELETDNLPETGDERRISGSETGHDPVYHAAALARVARLDRDYVAYRDAAEQAFRWRMQQSKRDPIQLVIALDLFEITGEDEYATLARDLMAEHGGAWLKGIPLEAPEYCYLLDAFEQFDAVFGQNHRDAIRSAVVRKAEELLDRAHNPFGIYTFGTRDRPNYFNTPAEAGGWHIGNSSHVLNAAAGILAAHRYAPNPKYLAFAYDQFNWILGNNPYGICLMEGAGTAHLPTYHQRLTFAGVPRGAVPGGVVNGVTWRAASDDRPYLDLRGLDIPDFEPNEVWLPHNTAYLNALVNLEQAKTRVRPE